MTDIPRGGVKVVGVHWDQDQRTDETTPYHWRVTFDIVLTNGWGIAHALRSVMNCINRGEAGDGSCHGRIGYTGPKPFDPQGGVQ